MKRDIECEKEEILRRIEETIDPKLRKMLASIADTQEPRLETKVIVSTEGTTNASAK